MVPVGTGAADGAFGLLGTVGDACAGRPLGFARRRADLAARFARYRGHGDEQVAASWIAGIAAELGLLQIAMGPDAPLHGARAVVELGLPQRAADTVRWHREHDDGTGFPDRLRWDGIPADAAALGVVQFFLETIDDPNEPRPPAEALVGLSAQSGRRFGVEVVRAFRAFIIAEGAADESCEPTLPKIDDDAVVATVARWLDARADRTRGRTERLLSIVAPLVPRLALEEARAARIVRLYALGGATPHIDEERADPLSRHARERQSNEARRAATIAAAVARYAAEAGTLSGSAAWYEERAGDRYAALLALAVAIEQLSPDECAHRIAAAAGTQFDPEVARAYAVTLGGPAP